MTDSPPDVGAPRRALAIVRPYLLPLAISAVVGAMAIRAITKSAGGPAAPLDDAFIHLTFARRIAEGHPFSYVRGEGYVSGATSFLWPLLLAPFHLLGLRGSQLLWGAWILGWISHAGLALEAHRITRRLAGVAAGAGTAAIVLLFPAFAWFAWSGMETITFAWALLGTARVAAAYCEPEPGRAKPSARTLIALGILAPLLRPEGALASLIAAIALAVRTEGPRKRRLLAFAPLAGPLVLPLLNLVMTGHAASSTAQVKWAIGNPYYTASTLFALFAHNVKLLFTDVMDGGGWSWIFLPERSLVGFGLGAIAMGIAAVRRKVPFHALFVILIVLGAIAPTTYLSFLWNRLRYIWPFASAWCVLLGCLSREVGDLLRIRWRRLTFVTPLLVGLMAGGMAMRLPNVIKDLATSSRAIQRQQVALGKWASTKLPAEARIGVNDTGAIAYLSGRPTFDIVGLTTEGEARYWVAGAGSRFEHYEKLPREKLPTHAIVYPAWFGLPPLLGRKLHEATVRDQSILGGATMVAHEVTWEPLGTGALPAAPPKGLALVDEVDVADLESEVAHRYELGRTHDPDNLAKQHFVEGHRVMDGGRMSRARDRFRVKLPAGQAKELVMRVWSARVLDLSIQVAGRSIGVVHVPGSSTFHEPSVTLPRELGGEVEVIVAPRDAKARFGAFHYWVFAGP